MDRSYAAEVPPGPGPLSSRLESLTAKPSHAVVSQMPVAFFVPTVETVELQQLVGTWRDVVTPPDIFDGVEGLSQVTNDALGEPPGDVLERVSKRHGDAWWLELEDEWFGYQHWHDGVLVRALTYDGTDEQRGWFVIQGVPDAWEAAAPWGSAPKPGALGLRGVHDLVDYLAPLLSTSHVNARVGAVALEPTQKASSTRANPASKKQNKKAKPAPSVEKTKTKKVKTTKVKTKRKA